jgi:hypothetical protein
MLYAEEERRRVRPKRVRPSVGRKRPVYFVVLPPRMTFVYSSVVRLVSGPFPAHRGVIRYS